MNKKYDILVFIGRMQPPHRSHIEIIRRALNMAEHVVIMIGSAVQPRTIENPWTWYERQEMIEACFDHDSIQRITCVGVADVYNNQQWVQFVQKTVHQTAMTQIGDGVGSDETFEQEIKEMKIGIIGHKKDHTSFYLDMFPQWTFEEVENIEDINSTDVRKTMFEYGEADNTILPEGIYNYIEAFINSEHYTVLKEEYEHIIAYKKAWETAPYAPIFVTTDAVVVQSGHILLIRRRSVPGLRTWALPGGFVNQTELLEDAMLRELREETKLKVPEPVLRGNIKDSLVFDNPKRSLRGRTITHAFYIELPSMAGVPLPKVKGSDDADRAKWVPLDVVDRMQDQLFEDHYLIIKKMTGG